MSSTDVSVPTYMGGGDPDERFTAYYPKWLDNLAGDVTIEGSLLNGVVQGPEAVREIIGAIRTLYGDSQQVNFAGPWGDKSFVEDYTAHVGGEPIGCVVLVTRNAADETQHIAANYRPLGSVLLFSRLMGEKFAGTEIGRHFLQPD